MDVAKGLFFEFREEVARLLQNMDGEDIIRQVAALKSTLLMCAAHNPQILKDLELKKIYDAAENILNIFRNEKSIPARKDLLNGLLEITKYH